MKKLTAIYDFVANEKEMLKLWEDADSFHKLLEKNKEGKKYRFIDGPITANNPMGIHHVWGRTLKDTFLRYKAMNGYLSHYRNGFDGQGLWVEVEVEKDLGFKTKRDIEEYGLDKFTQKCVERVKKYSGIITEQSKRLGQWMEWDNSYYTYKDENITGIWAFLKECHNHGWIKQIYKSFPWCPRCGTSLSEHEMTGSYKEMEHEAVFFKLPLIGMDCNILVWTTTPWTLSSNVALAVNAEFDYVKVKFPNEDKPIIMARDVFYQRFKSDNGEILETFKGETLKDIRYEAVYPELDIQKEIDHRIVLWDEVSKEDGSGVVHIAPGCGAEDFDLGKRENLPVVMPIDEYGNFYEGFGFMSGKSASELNEVIFDELKKRNKLFFVHHHKHSYPVCWRCKTPILFRVVKEWAIDVEELRPKLIANAQKVKWYPDYQGKRMEDWLNNMSDWNISRKRFYGLPLPFYVCSECGELTVVGSKDELKNLAIDKQKVDELPELHRPWIDDIKIDCPKCHKPIDRVKEVGDVWLDAGIVPFSTLKYFEDKAYWQSYFPAEYVVEMKEQIRLWFYSMLFMSTVLIDEPPYEKVGTYGMVTAEDGTKFSKTGFMIRFEDVAEKLGADVARYIYTATSPVNDVRFGFTLGEEVKRKLLSFWNMSVFFATYASIDKVDLSNFEPTLESLDITDKWLIKNTDCFIKDATAYMEDYNTKDLIVAFEKFVDEVSNFYIRINRRRFWKSEDSMDKNVAYYSLFRAIKATTQIVAPIIPFITEYTWQNVIKEFEPNNVESVHLSVWPQVSNYNIDDEIINTIEKGREVITAALKIRNEQQIKVRQPLSMLYVQKTENDNLMVIKDIICNELNVKNIKLLDNLDELKEAYLTLNFKNAGAVLKGDVNLVKDLLSKVSPEDMNEYVLKVNQGLSFKLPSYDLELNSSLFIIEYKTKPNIVVVTVGNREIALDLTVTTELKKEGIIRDIIRQCQVFRKEAGFDVENRIYINFNTEDSLVKEILDQYHDYIQTEMLATIVDELIDNDFENTVNEDNYSVSIKLKKI